VAEEHAPEPVDVERHRERPGEHGRVTLVAQSFAAPGLEIAVGVPEHDERAVAEPEHALERLRRPWTGDHIAAEHDPVDLLALDLGQHGVERREVAVHVVERRDAHYAGTAAAAAARAASARRTRRRARDSPRTRSRSASAGTRRPAAARSRRRARPRAPEPRRA
jgi:hypothetical protein